ncbi:sodium:calcium antiporter [Caldicellulosiruptor morganii]|uniref:sodium:calcium antiporter n=1 Tax=Caldicellulosiruptor morganii TaxID=1387555 RepID=UPI0005EAEADC
MTKVAVTYVIKLIFSLFIILFGCTFFTNAVEWFGKRMNLGQGAVGSILAAVGTALPETIIPIIAILFARGESSHQVGIGAIAGAPFMLGTLAFFITGLATIIYTLLKKRTLKMNVDLSVFERDLTYFLIVYGIAVLTTFIHNHRAIRVIIAIILFVAYIIYVKKTLADESEETEGEELEELYFAKFLKLPNNLFWILAQLLLSLLLIIYGAHLFVDYVQKVATIIGVPALILSIIITPIATELPEKLNSVIWIGKKKDTLALGNITGAMVFQSSVPVVFGIIFTPWDLKGITMVSAILAFVSALLNLLWVKIKKSVNPVALLFGGVLYLIFLGYVFL